MTGFPEGSRDGVVARALALALILSWSHVWVEFVVISGLALSVFLKVLQFSSLYKNQHSKLQFDQDGGPT